MIEYDWWMHFHADSRPKEEGDQVAFKGINQKGKRRQGTCLLLLLLYVFLLSSLLHIIQVLQSSCAT